MKQPTKPTWEDDIRKTIENWKYNASDDILASALADEILINIRSLLQAHDKELVERLGKMKETGEEKDKSPYWKPQPRAYNKALTDAQKAIRRKV